MSKLPSDFQQRELALDPTQSFICEAPAGSGKTELLTQRVLTLLARVEKPEQILAITFTRKAAGEMRERVFHAIQSGLSPKPSEPHRIKTWELAKAVLETDKKYQWQLLETPNRLQIKTFDSLCGALASSLPLESSFGAKPKVSEESEELYRHSARALLHSLEDDAHWVESLSVLLKQLDNKYLRLEELLMSMLGRREEWMPLIEYQQDQTRIKQALESNLKNALTETLTIIRQQFPQDIHKPLVELAGFAAANLEREGLDSPILQCKDMDVNDGVLPGTQSEDVDQWLGILSLLTKKDGDWRSRLDKRCGFPAGENAAEKSAFKERKQALLDIIEELKTDSAALDRLNILNELHSLPTKNYNEAQWALLNALFEVLPILAAQLTLAFKSTNTVDFSEISIRARQALGALHEPTQLALRMDYKIQHILVDEFQDTSYSQIELLERLTEGWQPGDQRTLFCVGDAMQSIYGFRGANVGLFLNCRERGLGDLPLTPLRLNTNFRSQAGVVDWVNKTFSKAFPTISDISRGAVTYSSSEPFHDNDEQQAVFVHGFIDHQDNLEEAQKSLEIIKDLRSNAPEKTIAILVRNRNHVKEIAAQLKIANIKYRAVELEPLQDHSIIQDLMALTQALLHPGDRTAWLALFRAPWCGLSLMDLEAIANVRLNDSNTFPTVISQASIALTTKPTNESNENPEQSDLFASNPIATDKVATRTLSQDGRDRLNRILPLLETSLNNKDRKGFRHWVEGLWIALGGPACLASDTELTNAKLFFNLLDTWPYSTDLPSLEHLQKAINKLFAAPDPDSDDSLQIMTIHKSKGLEFDVVIVPALHKTPRRGDPSLLMWHQRLNQQGKPELLMAPITASGDGKHPIQNHLQTENAKKDYFETCRLLYVACTRAKQTLYLFANLKANEKNGCLKEPSKTALMHAIWPAIKLQVIRHELEATEATPIKSSIRATKPLYRLPKDWQLPELPKETILDRYIPRYQYSDDHQRVDLNWQSPSARHTGTLIHRYLQLFVDSGIQSWSPDRVQQLRKPIMAALKALAVPNNDIQDSMDKVVLALKLILQDNNAKDMLSNKHPFHACEYPITLKTQTGPKNLVIDRVYTTRQGTTWVVDYKTATPEPEQSLEEFLEHQRQQYEPQLKLYQFALQQAGFEKVKIALYFPMITQWLSLDQKAAEEA
ncbi:MAG: UvrD-helicase domain-containing protein [Pseudomonadales bacterium]|nr:UvrD-helicase domain-containing protein [Pseudomonadales bacterium]